MAAYTVTSSLAQILPDPAGRPSESDVYQAKLWTAINRRNFPGQSTQDRFTQSDNYVGAAYVAVQSLMKGLSGASIKVLKRRSQGGGLTSQDAGQNKDWTPAPPNHPLVQLFEHVNPVDTLMSFLGQYVMCRSLFGRVFVYSPPARDGKPCELYVIRPQYMTPAYLANEHYPFGAWRLTLPSPFMYGFSQAGLVVLDARQVVEDRLPHPKWPWDGYSPLAAGGQQLDALRLINESRKGIAERGPSVDAMITVNGASEQELQRLNSDWSQKYTGTKGARVMFGGGEDVKAVPLGIAPKDLGFDSAYEQLTNFCLSLFGVPHPVAGLTDTTSYAQLYASLQQFRTLKLQPEANEIAAVWTKHLAHRHWGNDYRISIELPELLDPGVVEDRRKAMVSNGSITVNEDRATANLEPLPDADLPASVYLQKVQQQIAPPPMPGMAGAEGLAPSGAIGGGMDEGDAEGMGGMAGDQPQDVGMGGEMGAEDGGQAQNQMSDAVLQALGVQGGDEPGMMVKSRMRKGWTQFTTKTGGVGARNEQGREIYGEDAKAALAGQNKPQGQPATGGKGKHTVHYSTNGKQQKADVEADSPEDAHAMVTALGGKVHAVTPAGGTAPTPAPAGPGGKKHSEVMAEQEKDDQQLRDEVAQRRGGQPTGPKPTPKPTPKPAPTPTSPSGGGAGGAGGAGHITNAADLDAGYAQRAAQLGAKSSRPGDKVSRIVRGTSKQYTEYESGFKYPHYDDNGIRTPHGMAAGAPEKGAGDQPGGSPADQLTQMTQGATFPPQALPVAKRAKAQIAKVVPALTPVAESPAGQAALRDVAKWGKIAADKHADLIAASTGLDNAQARDLFLVILTHLVRSLPVVGGVASGVTAAVGAHLRNQDRRKMTGAVREHGKAQTQLEYARRRAARAGVNPDQEPGDDGLSLPRSAQRDTGVTRPKNKVGAGSLPPRIGKSAVRFALRVNKSLKQG